MRRRFRTFLFGGIAGAAIAYLFDPQLGADRRAQLAERLRSKFGSRGRLASRDLYGRLDTDYDDVTLARKVETELFADPTVPKGNINVNVVDGVVELRGQVERPEHINTFESRVRTVAGVVDVTNLLHLPDTPAPNKQEAREAG